jgi:hypothetical protein
VSTTPNIAPAAGDDDVANGSKKKPVMRQRVLNVLGMYPHKAQPSLGRRADSAAAAAAAAAKSSPVLHGMWALIRQSPVLPMKRSRELWQFVHVAAEAMGANEKELSQTRRMVNLAAAATTAAAAAPGSEQIKNDGSVKAAAPAPADA